MPKNNIKATVFIPTFNGEAHLNEILKQIFAQKVDFSYDVLIIDSGSTDKTLSIIKKYQKKHKNLTLHIIPNEEYGHGKTRQYAATIADGEIVVYLSHDAVPSHKQWLYEMVKPFELNDKIAGVMGKQIPRPGCFPLLKYEILHVFSNFGPHFGTTLFYKDDFIIDQPTYDAVTFYSDVNSAARKDVLLGKVPYRDVQYAEDQIFGRDIIDGQYVKAYSPRGSVFHSNDLRLKEYKLRMFDETLGLRKAGIPISKMHFKTAIKMTVKGMIGDSIRILRDKEYSWKRTLYWLAINPLFHIEKWRGVYRAANIDLNDKLAIETFSLESKGKLK